MNQAPAAIANIPNAQVRALVQNAQAAGVDIPPGVLQVLAFNPPQNQNLEVIRAANKRVRRAELSKRDYWRKKAHDWYAKKGTYHGFVIMARKNDRTFFTLKELLRGTGQPGGLPRWSRPV